jgi:hypothetical protein
VSRPLPGHYRPREVAGKGLAVRRSPGHRRLGEGARERRRGDGGQEEGEARAWGGNEDGRREQEGVSN